jgi:TRAP-type C4-dicarboxylate transport system permease small subunit
MTKLYQAVLRVEARVAATFLVAMVLLIFSGGIARLMGEPLNWTTDAATCLFAWACFLCADVAWRRDALMSVEVLTDRLPPRWQKLLRLVNYLLIGAFLVYVTTMGLWLSWISRARSFQGIPEISYSWVTMSMPVGGLLLLVTTVLKARSEFARAEQAAKAAQC